MTEKELAAAIINMAGTDSYLSLVGGFNAIAAPERYLHHAATASTEDGIALVINYAYRRLEELLADQLSVTSTIPQETLHDMWVLRYGEEGEPYISEVVTDAFMAAVAFTLIKQRRANVVLTGAFVSTTPGLRSQYTETTHFKLLHADR